MQIYIYDNGIKHNLIEDILDNGTALFSDGELPIADSSYRYSEIMGDDNVVVNFSLPVFFEFPIGCRINVDYTEYTLVELGNITKQNERWYDYTLTFESPAKQLSRYKFRNHVDGRLNFTLTAQPLEFLTHIITNLNQREGANNWMLGDCIVSSEKTQSFSHNTILDALNAVAQLFETEWEIVNKTISLKKVEYNKANPITLSYGKGNGFKSGIARQLSGEKAVDVLWIEGGDRNIDSQTYTYQKTISGKTQTLHANKLRLPRNAQFVYVPSDNEPDQYGIINRGTLFTLSEWNAMTPAQRSQYSNYMRVSTDEDGFGVSRSTYINNGYEESLEATDIYPKKVLTVTSVTESNPTNHFFEIKDSNNDVNYADCIIGGEQATIIFESGMLTGKEFNWSKYTHSTKQFDIVPQEIDGITMPDRPTGYIPVVGDTFAVFHISLPQQYITNAEQELLLTACEYLYKHGEVEVEFNGTVDGIWAKSNWESLAPYFRIGGYINFTDNAFCQDGKKMRILSVKTYLSNPHSPEITLSNSSVSQSVSSELKKIPQNQVSAKNDLQQQISYTERSFRDTKETQKALEEAIENIDTDFTESISPVSVQTMQMIVGSNNLQFAFGSATTTTQSGKQKVTAYTVQTWNPTYTNGTLVCTASHLKHYTIAAGTEITSGAASVATFPYWAVSAANLTPPDPDKNYYLYAVCPKSGTQTANLGYLTSPATFTLSDTSKAHTNDNYYFLIGILNKVHDGTRSFASCYGFTEIMGNRISTDRIVSADGNTYIDLVTGEISSNKAISFKYNGAQADLATTISGLADTASEAASAASTAQSTADTAKQLAENIKVGGRNLLKDADCTVATTYGIKATKDSEGWFKITGTSTATANTLLYPRWKYGNYSENDTIAKNGIYTVTVEDESNILSNYFTIQVVVANHNETSGSSTHFYEGGVKTFDLTNKWLMRVTLYTNANSNGITYNGRIRVKLEKGNQSTDWTPAPEDVDADIASAYDLADTANTAAGNAATAAAQANTAINTINTDNVFSIIEKKTIRIEWYAIHGKADTTSTANASGSYQKALTAASETDVATSTLTTAYTNLKNYLNTNKLYTQENTTGFNRTTLSTYFTAYYNAETALYDAIADYYAQQAQAAAEALAQQAQLLAECAQLIKDAYLMYRDTEFTLGKNDLKAYNNTSGSSAVTVTRAAANNLPNGSGYQLIVKTNGTASPGCGGIRWSWSARYNAVYIVVMKCKIPTGYYLDFVQNSVGSDYVKAWATTADGDGTWRDYVVYLKCGSDGNITTTGYIALRPKSGYSATSVTWYIASAAVFDCTATEWLNLAFKNSTDIQGGVVLSNIVQVRDNDDNVTAGINGLNPNAVGKNPRFWAGGTYSDAVTAASVSDQDIPSAALPILLTDQGYNSNIGIFKVLENAIAVMRSGQVIRISTDTYDNEKDNAPIAPVTRTLATGKQLNITTSNYNNATQTWNIGTFPKQATFDILIPALSISAEMDFSRTMYTTGNVTGSLNIIVEVLAGGKSVTILDTSLSTTVTATSGNTYGFTKSQSLTTTSRTLSNVSGSSTQYVQLKITSTINTTGSGGTVTYCDSFVKTTAALTVTISENQSCFILAKGGFACAQTSAKSLLFDAAAGTFDYNGSTFKVNGRDFLNSRGQVVTTGSGYVQLSRIGQVVTCKLNIPESSMSTSAIIPSGYRPTINIDVLCTTGNSSTAYLVTIGANGSITSAALPNNTVAYGVVSYVTADNYPS